MTRLYALTGWRLVLTVFAVAMAVGLGVWALVWVAWTIRPLLAVTAAVAAAAWALHVRRRHYLETVWHEEEWLGS